MISNRNAIPLSAGLLLVCASLAPAHAQGLRARYFGNKDFTAPRFERIDPAVSFDWMLNAPDPRVGPDDFSIRWTGQLLAQVSGNHTLRIRADDFAQVWLDGRKVIDASVYTGNFIGAVVPLVAGQRYPLRVDYAESGGLSSVRLHWIPPGGVDNPIPPNFLIPAPARPTAGEGTGLRGEYFNQVDFTGRVLERLDAELDFNWGAGAPVAGLEPDTFSVRWSGQLLPLYSELHTFSLRADDSARLMISGVVIAVAAAGATVPATGTVMLEAGKRYDVRVEYVERELNASIRLSWASPSLPEEVVPFNQLFVPPPPMPMPMPDPINPLPGKPTAPDAGIVGSVPAPGPGPIEWPRPERTPPESEDDPGPISLGRSEGGCSTAPGSWAVLAGWVLASLRRRRHTPRARG
jgi:hypothetical protein